MEWKEEEHPRDVKGQFTKAKTVSGMAFKKTGETTILVPENKKDTYCGKDYYPQNISHYELIKEARNDYKQGKIVNVALDADIQKKFDNATPKERTQIAREYILNKLRGVYPSKNSIEIYITRKTAKEITNTKYLPKIRVSPHLSELIQSGEFKETKKASHGKFNRFIYYDVNLSIGSQKYNAILNVGVDKQNNCVLYDINQFEEK